MDESDVDKRREPQGMNPRYLAYCRAHSKTPDAMLAHDDAAWPGGKMTGFILWMSEQWHAFMVTHCPHKRGTLAWDMFKAQAAESDGLFDQWQAKEIPA
jgi:hypothetical protein